jgi:hypothetical protein
LLTTILFSALRVVLRSRFHLDGQKAVVYRSKMNPGLGRNFEAMDPLE